MARKVFELCTKFCKIISINLLPNEIIFVFLRVVINVLKSVKSAGAAFLME